MGISLIAAGVIGLCYMFIKDFNIIKALSFSPVILIFLGIEMLVFYFIKNGEKLRFDFMSCFISLVIFIISISAMLIIPLYNTYGPPLHRYEHKVKDELYDKCYNSLKAFDCISDYSVNVSVYASDRYDANTESKNEEINITLWNSYTKCEGFIKDCSTIMTSLNKLNIEPDNVNFTVKDNEKLSLTLKGALQQNFDYAHMLELIK